MFNVSKYLEKFTKNIKNFELDKNQIIKIILIYTNINIPLDSIEIKNNILYIKGSPAIKNKIFIYKRNILEEINKNNTVKILEIR